MTDAEQKGGVRVLVCGGREFAGGDWLFAVLGRIHRKRTITCVIHGAARGADTLADRWAQSEWIDRMVFPAQWRTHGKAAGPIRNQQMLDEGKPDVVVAFPGGRGTAHMVKIAREAGVPVYEPPNPQAYFIDRRANPEVIATPDQESS